MNWKRIILSTVLVWLTGTVFMFLTCGWLFSWVYEIPPIIWKPAETMMQASTMIWSNVLGLVLSFIFAFVFHVIYKGIPCKKNACKGLVYGTVIWLVTALGQATLPLYMTIAPGVVVYWILQSFVRYLFTGAIVGALYKK